MNDADVIIVGAGTAGCVLASRLSEAPERRVLLLEAGCDFEPGSEPADIQALYPLSYFNPRYLWRDVKVRWCTGRSPASFSQGRLVGGGSAVMGMWAVRGFPEDYDAWAAAGALGWAWRDVLPFFVRAERDLDFEGPSHGREGAVPIRRQPDSDWPPFCRAVATAGDSLGLAHVRDMNADFRDGISVLPIAATERRVSAAAAYLTREVRARPNLSIVPQVECGRILFDGIRAIGVETRQGRILRASQVILSAGALQSPAILMRSGVGAPRVLEALAVPVVSARAGVGENLQNHPVIALGMHLRPPSLQPDPKRSAAFFCIRMSCGREAPSDLYLSVLNRSSWHYFGRRLATIGVMLHKPSSRGRVRITSARQGTPLSVDFGMLSHPSDLQRLGAGLRTAVQLLGEERVAATGKGAGLVTPGLLSQVLAHRTLSARAMNGLCSALLPRFPSIEARLLAQVLGRVPLSSLEQASDASLQSLLQRHVAGVFHPVGTCRMGRAEDTMAVVDEAGRVHGTQALRVVDASIMPEIPRAGTFLPSVMIAEKIAAAICNH